MDKIKSRINDETAEIFIRQSHTFKSFKKISESFFIEVLGLDYFCKTESDSIMIVAKSCVEKVPLATLNKLRPNNYDEVCAYIVLSHLSPMTIEHYINQSCLREVLNALNKQLPNIHIEPFPKISIA